MYGLIINLILLMVIFSCSPSEADLEEADRLIESRHYAEALPLLQAELLKDFSDTTQYERIRHRIFLVHKGQFFEDLVRYRREKAWSMAAVELSRLDSVLRTIPEDSSRLFRFDYYIYHSEVDSVLGDREAWSMALYLATQFPLGNEETIRDIFAKLAFYQAEQADLEKAIDMMDSMMRAIQIRSMEPSFKSAFYLYMEGEFENALNQLKQIPVSEKDRHWKRLERFLEKYHNQLKQQNRFKLW